MAEIKQILQDTKVIAVVGLSPNSQRDSHRVAGYMQSKGYRVIPVNPNTGEVLGEKSYPNLRDIPHKVDMVNVFRSSQHLPQIVDDALEIGAKSLWTQLGVIHEESTHRARDAGLDVVTDRCMMVEHRKIVLDEG